MREILVALLFLSLSTEQVTATETNRLDADLRCLVASLFLLNSPDPQFQAAGSGSFVYWLGRVDGAAPDLDLESEIASIAEEMSETETGQELIRCGGELAERGRAVSEIGGHLTSSQR